MLMAIDESDSTIDPASDAFFLLPSLCTIAGANQLLKCCSKFRHVRRGGAAPSRSARRLFVPTVRHTVVASRVSLNAGCVDPS